MQPGIETPNNQPIQNTTNAAPGEANVASALEITPPAHAGPKPRPTGQESLALAAFVGEVDVRTPAEDAEFAECEEIVGKAWVHLSQAGEALLRIRDKGLFKNEYPSFECYCQQRWGIGRSQAYRYLAAGQVYQNLAAVPGIPLPDCEAQIRPLVGLTPAEAYDAWIKAVTWSKDGRVPAVWVKRAVKQVVKSTQPVAAADGNAERQRRFRSGQSIRTALEDLSTLLMAGAERDVLLAKVGELGRLLEPFLGSKKKGR